MMISQEHVAKQLAAYLRHEIDQAQLVDWAERQVMDGEFESTIVRDAVARLGLADVRAFGLTWEDCERLLREMGFTAHIDIEAA
jgi:cobyrinic acid a,c-diamide synthase